MNFDYTTATSASEHYSDSLLKILAVFITLIVLSVIMQSIFKRKGRKALKEQVPFSSDDSLEDYTKNVTETMKKKNGHTVTAEVFLGLAILLSVLAMFIWAFGVLTISIAYEPKSEPFVKSATDTINKTYDVTVTETEVKKLLGKGFDYSEAPSEEYVSFGVVETLSDDDVVSSTKLVWVRDEFRLVHDSEGSKLVEVNKR